MQKVHTILKLGIDADTKDVKLIMSKLKKLKTTVSINDGGMYHQDHSVSQVHINTVWSEEELDNWLLKTTFPRNVTYYGTFRRRE